MQFNRIFITAFLVLFGVIATAQTPTVYVRYNKQNQEVKLRWFLPTLMSKDGVNVYRQVDNTSWQKLNTQPWQKGSETNLSNSTNGDFQNFKTLLDDPTFDFQANDMYAVIIIQEIVKNESLAKYAGIQFSDKSVPKSGNVQYKVVVIENGTEGKELLSPKFDLSKDYLEPGPTNLRYKEKNKSISLGWENESQRYYGVNIYRSPKDNPGAEIKINELPVLYTDAPEKSKREKNSKPPFLYVDETIEKEVSYAYRLVAVDYFGEEAGEANPVQLSSKDIIPPAEPKKVTATEDHVLMNAVLTWEAELADDHAGFNILHSYNLDSNYQVLVAGVEKTATQTEVNLKRIGRHNLIVEAIDVNGNKAQSKVLIVDIEDKIAPSIPKPISLNIDSGFVVLKWQGVPEIDLKGYYVYRKKTTDPTYKRVTPKPLTTTEFREQFAPNYVSQLQYQITSKDTIGNISLASETISFIIKDKTPPPTPQIEQVRLDSNKIYIEWLPVACNDLKGYNLFKMDAADSSWERVNIGPIIPTTTRFTDRNVEARSNYAYRLQAIDTAENVSEYSSNYLFSTPAEKQDLKIEDFTATARKKGGVIRFNWKVNEPQLVLAYILMVSEDNGQNWMPLTGKLTEASYQHKSTPGTYQFQLKAIDKKGKKKISKAATVVVEPKK
jgi:hypothetical protein